MENVSGIFTCLLTFLYSDLCVSIFLCSCSCVFARTPVRMVSSVPVYSFYLYVCMYGTYVCMCLCYGTFHKALLLCDLFVTTTERKGVSCLQCVKHCEFRPMTYSTPARYLLHVLPILTVILQTAFQKKIWDRWSFLSLAKIEKARDFAFTLPIRYHVVVLRHLGKALLSKWYSKIACKWQHILSYKSVKFCLLYKGKTFSVLTVSEGKVLTL